jgi:hypothetical protein
LDMPLLCAELIYAVAQVIGGGAPEFVSELGQKVDSSPTMRPRFLIRLHEFPKPVEHRRFAVGLLVKGNECSWHILFTKDIITILI